MTIDSATAYTDAAIEQCRTYLIFLKKRQAIETEYAKQMSKLFESSEGSAATTVTKIKSIFDLAAATSFGNVSGTGGANAEGIRESTAALTANMSLWTALKKSCDDIETIATEHKAYAKKLDNDVIEPLNKLIKRMELKRKAIVDEAHAETKAVQELYTTMKKAKQISDECQHASNSVVTVSLKKTNSPYSKGKELDKWAAKASAAQEKAHFALENLKNAQEACRVSQKKFYESIVPRLLEQFKEDERERCWEMLEILKIAQFLDAELSKRKQFIFEQIGMNVAAVDLDDDLDTFVEEHMSVHANEESEINVTVFSLLNPTKTARMNVLMSQAWKSRYCILMGGERKLYIFAKEDSLKAKRVVDLEKCYVLGIHESAFSKSHTLLISIRHKDSNNNFEDVYIQAESAKEKKSWLAMLRLLVRCCNPCAMAKRFSYTRINADNISDILSLFASSDASVTGSRDSDLNGSKLGERQYFVNQKLKMTVHEARGLPEPDILRKTGYYCQIALDKHIAGKTLTVINSASPFWGDEVHFDDLPECTNSIRITLFVSKQLQKDSEIGSVDIDLTNAKEGRIEEWLQLTSANGVTLRVSYQLSREKVISSTNYMSLLQYLSEPTSELFEILASIHSREEIAKIVVHILSAKQIELRWLKQLADREIQQCADENILFRANSIATKAIDYYMKLVGISYLKNILFDFITSIYKSHESCEIDPTRLDKPEDAKKNIKRLTGLVQAAWDLISFSSEKCPPELRDLFSFIREKAAEKFAGKEATRYSAVSGFLFLRFFCPAILNPKLFGLADELPEGNTARTLTLIAKTLQNLANGIGFEAKEPHMLGMNTFLAANMQAMKDIIIKFSTAPTQQPIKSRAYLKVSTNLADDLAALYRLLQENPVSSPITSSDCLTPPNFKQGNGILAMALKRIEDEISTKEAEWIEFKCRMTAANDMPLSPVSATSE